jgi:hypothetical protein
MTWRDDVEALLLQLLEAEAKLAKINQAAETRWYKLIQEMQTKGRP